jgi:hypothetical protein
MSTFQQLTTNQQTIINEWAKRTISTCLVNDNWLVDALVQESGNASNGQVAYQFQYDNITNLYPVIPSPNDIRDEWDTDQCFEFLAQWGRVNGAPKLTEENTDTFEEELADYTASVAEELADDSDPQEIFEWWRVTDSWLAGKLEEIGEPILDNDYGTWWGRTCSGQSIILDGTMQGLYLHVWGAPTAAECEDAA